MTLLSNKVLSDKALKYVRKNRKEICNKFCSIEIFPSTSTLSPITIFMAGSPGAGKTEYSKKFINQLENENPEEKIVHIDADKIRKILPGYNGKNSSTF